MSLQTLLHIRMTMYSNKKVMNKFQSNIKVVIITIYQIPRLLLLLCRNNIINFNYHFKVLV